MSWSLKYYKTYASRRDDCSRDATQRGVTTTKEYLTGNIYFEPELPVKLNVPWINFNVKYYSLTILSIIL